MLLKKLANSVSAPHGDQIQADGRCPPEMDYFNGYCHECCLNRMKKEELEVQVKHEVEFVR